MKEKITIRDIAERAGTSKTTVSFFLNGKTDKMSEETQARIAQVIKETNYRPSIAARSLNAKETRLIGVIIGDITNTFALSKSGFRVKVEPTLSHSAPHFSTCLL